MRRRQVLAALGAVSVGSLAGCADPAGVLHLDAVGDAEIAERASRNLSRAPPEVRGVVAEAVENGSATANGTSPPVDRGPPVSYDGAYYNLTWTATEVGSYRLYDVAIDYDPEEATGRRVAYEDLPEVDREALTALVPPRDDRRVEGYDLGAGLEYTDAEAERSELVPDPAFAVLVHEGNEYRLRVGDGREVTTSAYRYDATAVAPSAAAYATQLRERYLFALSGLSDAEREVVETAIDDGYYAESTDDDAFRSVAERLRGHDAVTETEFGGNWLLRYEGTAYWADLHLGQFAGG